MNIKAADKIRVKIIRVYEVTVPEDDLNLEDIVYLAESLKFGKKLAEDATFTKMERSDG